MMKNIPYI